MRGKRERRVTFSLKIIITQLCLIAFLSGFLTGFLLVWASEPPDGAETVQSAYIEQDDGRIPGDDIPATQVCFMTEEEIAADEAAMSDSHVLENVVVSHYCICQSCCGKAPGDWGYGVTRSGRKAVPDYSIAVDPAVIPLGAIVTAVYDDGSVAEYRADDTGSGISGLHIDVCKEDHAAAKNAGLRRATLYWEGGNV